MKHIFAIAAPIHQWFNALPLRDQKALRILGIVLIALCFWLVLWQPAQRARTQAEIAYKTVHTDLAWMKQHRQESAIITPVATLANDAPLLTILSAAAQTNALMLSQAEPAGNGSLRVSLEHISFTRLLFWLHDLDKQQIYITQMSIDKTPNLGEVNATLTFTR